MRAPGVAALFGFDEEFLDRLDILAFEGELKFLQVLDENAEDADEIFSVGEGDVAPHFGGAGGDAGGVAKAGGANHGLLLGMDGAENVIGQFRRNDMGQMAGTTDQIVMGLGAEADRPAAEVLPETFDLGDGLERG